jgi:hypothetical protein
MKFPVIEGGPTYEITITQDQSVRNLRLQLTLIAFCSVAAPLCCGD